MIRRTTLTLFGSPRRSLLATLVACSVVAVIYGLIPGVRDIAAIVAVPLVVIAGWAFKYPNETKQVVGRLLAHLTFLGGPVERESIRQDLEGTLSAGLQTLAVAAPAAGVSRVRLRFVRTGDQVSKLADGTVLVSIAPHSDRVRNLVASAWVFSQEAVIPEARPHLDADVSRGLDFAVTKLILSRADQRAVTEFVRSIWLPEIQNRARLRRLTEMLETLETDELLAPVLIEEFAALGIRRANRFPQEDVAEETARFVEHLHALANGEVIAGGPHFNGRHLRVGFVLMATPSVMAAKGENAYRSAVDWAVNAAYPRIYVIARGSHTSHAESVCAHFASDHRVLAIRPYTCTVTGAMGRQLARLVIQLTIDVKSYVDFGHRPIVAVGATFEQAAASRRKDRSRQSA